MRRSLSEVLVVSALTASAAFAADRRPAPSDQIQRGAYLARIGGCNACHTPLKMTASGPVPDTSRLLSGHPQDLKMPPPAKLAMPWMVSASATLTAWSGPWGISYAANLTPDRDTGMGSWDEATFLLAMHSGRHLGKGRPILPPMPWQDLAVMKEEDLKALWAYLRSIPAVKNRVPQAVIAPAPKAPTSHK
jgi:hypothetical protein